MIPITPGLIERIECAALTGEDVLGALAPDEEFRAVVVLQMVVVDGGLELVDAGVAAAADALCGDLGGEAFDQVHPGRAGWREMQLEAWVPLKPGLHLGRLVGGVVVEHQMNVTRFLHGQIDVAQKAEELLCAVTWQAFPDDQPRFDFQRCEKRGGSMALVVVGSRGRPALFERQTPAGSDPAPGSGTSRPRRPLLRDPADRGRGRRSR